MNSFFIKFSRARRLALGAFVLGALLCGAGGLVLADAVPEDSAKPDAAVPPPVARGDTAVLKEEPGSDAVRDLITYSGKWDQPPVMYPGPYDPNVARLTASMLQNMHYSRHPLDDDYSKRFYDRYMDLLDPQHLHFTQEDLKEFERYRTRLGELALQRGDTQPANEIFARFLKRLDQRAAYAGDLLKQNHFDFSGEDRYTPNRKDAPWPADLEAAKTLWRQHLRYEYLQEKLNKQKPEEITKKLAGRYKRLLRAVGEFDRDDVLQLYLTAMAHAYDPHSDYMGKAQLENFAINMNLSLFGIGALLRSDDGYCKIESLIAGGPAARSKKIKPGDRIIAVQQKTGEPVDVVDMKLNKVVDLIRGARNTEVTLTIIPADSADSAERKTVTLVRDEIKLEDQEAKAKLIEIPGADGKSQRVGVIDLPSFYANFEVGKPRDKSEPRSTTDDVQRLIKKLVAEGAEGIVLDLRRNGGGSLEEAVRLTGLFIKEGPIVQVRDANGEINVEKDPDPAVVYDGPLVVLTSRFSASASEILAAALQDYGRALVVGDKSTHGKGTVQTVYDLGKVSRRFPANYNPGALKTTIRKFYRANGSSTQLKGVTPDIVLPSVANHMEAGEGMHDYAMPWDTIPTAEFMNLGRIQPQVEELRRRSDARQAADKDFAYMREDIDHYKKAIEDKSLSLNYDERVKEREANEARLKARKEERSHRGENGEKAYEITLKLADQSGLPPAVGSTNATPASVEGENPVETAKKSADDAEDDELDKTPPVDVTLNEARRILLDLIELSKASAKAPAVAVSK